MRKYSGVLGMLFTLLGAPTAVFSQSVCEAAIRERAFDTQRRDVTDRIVHLQRAELCDRKYSSEADARSAVSGMGFDVGYAGYSLGFSQSSGETGHSVSISDSEFCTKSDSEFSREYISSNETQVASIAVSAWLSCIQSQNQLYLSYTSSASGKYVSGTMYVSVNTGTLQRTLKGLQIGSEGNVNVTCTINTETISAGAVSYELPATANRFNCVKTGDAPAEVSFITNQGPLDIISMIPTDPMSEEIRRLNQDIEILRVDKDKMNDRVGRIQADVGLLTGRLQALEQRSLRDSSDGTVTRRSLYNKNEINIGKVECPEGEALSGFDFEAISDGTIRGIGEVNYRCRSVQ